MSALFCRKLLMVTWSSSLSRAKTLLRALEKMMAGMQDKFAEFVLDVHGFDMKGPPPPLPQLVYDIRA